MPSPAVTPPASEHAAAPALALWTGLRRPNLVLVLALGASLLCGLVVHRDFGLSWDEPLFYAYADAVPYAYSPAAWFSGDFDLERAYGPSADDHKVYGPAYLLLARPLVRAWQSLSGDSMAEAWHLVNFATFLFGGVGLYFLLRRWVEPLPATTATVLFTTQPLLWGHAFINPKDIPFLVSFVWTILLGLRMVDRISATTLPGAQPAEAWLEDQPYEHRPPSRAGVRYRWAFAIAAVITAIGLLGYFLSSWVETALTETVLNAYNGSPERLLPRVFRWVAQDADNLPDDFYVARALSFFHSGRALALLVGLFALPLTASLSIAPADRGARRRALASRADSPRSLRLRPRSVDLRQAAITVAPAIVLGLASGLRILGPLAGLLIAGLYLIGRRPRSWLPILAYALVATAVMVMTWPYLWQAPVLRLLEVIQRSARNPAVLNVLFEGTVYPSNALPDSYFPTLLATTLTEPVWPLFFLGVAIGFTWIRRGRVDPGSFWVFLAWPWLAYAYVVVVRPPMYDGFRHFLFLLPATFVFIGVGLQWLSEQLPRRGLFPVVAALALVPGLLGISRLHPYSYAYFNSFVGGPAGAFRRFEADYWLTCYKEAMETAPNPGRPRTVFVPAQPSISAEYAPPLLTVEKFDPDNDQTSPGNWLLLPTRENMDLEIHPLDPVLVSVGRLGATYCVVKEVLPQTGPE